jgi:asparagine synthase (glutamine-hydrolysing)
MPAAVRGGLAAVLNSSPDLWGSTLDRLMPLMPARLRVTNSGDKVKQLAGILGLLSPDELYQRLVSHWNDPSSMVVMGREPSTALTDPSRQACLSDYTDRMMFADLVSYLPDDILTKVDRASMAVSLEARVPLLDHRVVEFAWRLPLDMKIRDGQGKWILRQVLYRYVPKELVERPKMGFGVPIGQWLRGSLREWAESLLDEQRLREEGYFRPEPVRRAWQAHLSGKIDERYRLWDILMFQAWLEAQRSNRDMPLACDTVIRNNCSCALERQNGETVST